MTALTTITKPLNGHSLHTIVTAVQTFGTATLRMVTDPQRKSQHTESKSMLFTSVNSYAFNSHSTKQQSQIQTKMMIAPNNWKRHSIAGQTPPNKCRNSQQPSFTKAMLTVHNHGHKCHNHSHSLQQQSQTPNYGHSLWLWLQSPWH